ncbi:hypothetical protein WJX72_009118 [[Myrmecia] bisecta]|uniref:Uncharacterized protein n=1 Tax=[Myrmecia] bisecta TaxID=41462 RepID=A0AAW1QS45_9CHLO
MDVGRLEVVQSLARQPERGGEAARGGLAGPYALGAYTWYITSKGARLPAKVVHIDLALQPPAYTVLLHGQTDVRETETNRLMDMTVDERNLYLAGELEIAGDRPVFQLGQRVWYVTIDSQRVMATIQEVDESLQPPAFCVQIEGQRNVRETEMHRLRPLSTAVSAWETGTAYDGIPCPVNACQGRLPERDLQGVAPEAYAAWNQAANEAAFAANGIIRCPNPECGALIERVLAPPSLRGRQCSPRVASPSAPAPYAGRVLHREDSQEGSTINAGPNLLHLPSQAVHQLNRFRSWGWGKLKRRRRSSEPDEQQGLAGGPPAEPSRPTAAAIQHKTQHRYRCAACHLDFCDECRASPYHDGYTCEEHRAPKCLYCAEPIMDPVRQPEELDRLSVKQLTQLLSGVQADSRWCMEKAELLGLAHHVVTICRSPACQGKLREACTKELPCGHRCGGVRGEEECLPCLEGCSRPSTASSSRAHVHGDDDCHMCCESLRSGPVILLQCGHSCHLDCAREQLRQGYPGPAISFNFMHCGLCRDGQARGNVQIASACPTMQHPALQSCLQRPLELRDQVVHRAKKRLRFEGIMATDPALQPGSEYDGRPADYALEKYMYFECCKCKQPYYGGERQCAVAADDGAAYNKAELICGSCSALGNGAVSEGETAAAEKQLHQLRTYIEKHGAVLPEGFRASLKVRQDGASKGKDDVYFLAPCGTRFRSRTEVARHLGIDVAAAKRAGPGTGIVAGDPSSSRPPAKKADRAGSKPSSPGLRAVLPVPGAEAQKRVLQYLHEYIERLGGKLDNNWRAEIKIDSRGAGAGATQVFYTAPDGRVFASRVEVAQALGLAEARSADLASDGDVAALLMQLPSDEATSTSGRREPSETTASGRPRRAGGRAVDYQHLDRLADANYLLAKEDSNSRQQQRAASAKRRGRPKRMAEVSSPAGQDGAYAKLVKRAKGQISRIHQEERLLEVYGADGWRGASREKVRPTAELGRARTQILKSKELLRECVKCCEHAQGDRVIPADTYDENGELDECQIFCAKCSDFESYEDNDIILCDGGCSRAYHEKCLQPPLKAAELPEDEGWLCPACDAKADILEMINDAFGTEYEQDTPWHHLFAQNQDAQAQTVAAANFDTSNLADFLKADLLDDDSEDEDYRDDDDGSDGEGARAAEPEAHEGSSDSGDESNSEGTSLASEGDGSEGAALAEAAPTRTRGRQTRSRAARAMGTADGAQEAGESGVDGEGGEQGGGSGGTSRESSGEMEELPAKRRRKAVDYRALNAEMFGDFESYEGEAGSDDEWGPAQLARRQRLASDE